MSSLLSLAWTLVYLHDSSGKVIVCTVAVVHTVPLLADIHVTVRLVDVAELGRLSLGRGIVGRSLASSQFALPIRHFSCQRTTSTRRTIATGM